MNEYFNKAFDLSGQVALVTGGGSGLGYAITKCLASAGATVVITGRREELLKQACDELGKNVHYYVHDITDTDAAPEFIKKIVDTARKRSPTSPFRTSTILWTFIFTALSRSVRPPSLTCVRRSTAA